LVEPGLLNDGFMPTQEAFLLDSTTKSSVQYQEPDLSWRPNMIDSPASTFTVQKTVVEEVWYSSLGTSVVASALHPSQTDTMNGGSPSLYEILSGSHCMISVGFIGLKYAAFAEMAHRTMATSEARVKNIIDL